MSPTPRWRDISGLTPENENSLPELDRRAAIRKLHAATEVEIRIELRAAADDTEFKSERTFLWEPLPAVCRRLEIAPSALNRLLKELTGMTATQLTDKIRAESLREALKAELTQHVCQRHAKPGAYDLDAKEWHEAFWSRLKFVRAQPNFSLAARATHLGFANYTRLYRACLLHYGQTPAQLEDEILLEIADFFALASSLKVRQTAQAPQNQLNPQFAPYREPFNDPWSQAQSTRPDWLQKNESTFGLHPAVSTWKFPPTSAPSNP